MLAIDEEQTLESELQRILDMVGSSDLSGMTKFGNPSNSQDIIHGSEAPIDKSDKMLSLTNKNFTSRKDLIEAARKIAFVQGYALVIRRSKSDKYVVLGCDRGGNYKSKKVSLEEREKKSASRLINCPFEIWGKKKRKLQGFWKLEIKSLLHNHEPSMDMSGHPYCRRFSSEEIMRFKEMCMAGIPPRQILSSLRQSNPHLLAISRNVYNMKAKILEESLAGRTVVQALLDELGEGGFSYNIEYDQEEHLTYLFFAHPMSIELSRSYSHVFLMDCTYKTNKYKMPLLDIIGVSSFNTSFYPCYVFMQKEEEKDYVWALEMFNKILGVHNQPLVIISDRELALMNAIRIVFPSAFNLLCVWHIEKNILANCKPHFKEEVDWVDFLSTWVDLIKSPNESSFDEAWERFENEYKENAAVLNYIRGTWLPLKEKFVSAWTDEVAHLGNRATSRAEGAHATLKKYLQVSTGGLREVKEKICLAIEHQFQEIKTQLSSEKVRVPRRLRIPFFEEVVTHVSMFALDELYKQYEAAKYGNLSSQYTCHFFKMMGIPCGHMIKDMKIQVLPLNAIHNQWRIDARSFNNYQHASLVDEDDQINSLLLDFKEKYEKLPILQKDDTKRQLSQFVGTSFPLILEPKVQPHKGRPLGSKKRKEYSSTRREPSKFEIVEKSRKCSVCKGVGHNKSTCPFQVAS